MIDCYTTINANDNVASCPSILCTVSAKDACRTLLLIHGAGGSHLSWPAVLRRLPQTAVYTLDLAGHGRSDPPSYTSIEAYAQDVADFIEALGMKQAVILGHSMGVQLRK